MVYRHEYEDGVWIDLERPVDEEIREVAREFSISERIETELRSPTPVPLAAGDADAAFAVLHFPSHESDAGDTRNQEIDIVVGRHFILTVRYEVVASLHHLQKLLEAQALLEEPSSLSTDVLLEILFEHLYSSVRDHANHVASHLSRVEEDMFKGRERETVSAISGISREFLHVEAALASQEEPLERFLKTLGEREFFGASFGERAARIVAERAQVAQLIHTHRAVASELRETNTALLSARQNEVMKTLTVINCIFLPLELIAFIFSMHVLGTPLEQNPEAFWIILAFMFVTMAGMTFFFVKRRWIF